MKLSHVADKVVLVTGSASGIGLRVSELLATHGAHLLATDRAEEELRKQAARLGWSAPGVRLRTLDVRDPAAWEAAVGAAVETWGRLDAVLCIAGVLKPGFTHEVSAADVDLHIDVNTKGVIHGTRIAARQMARQGSGHIVNIASLAGLAPVPGLSLYSASKFAVRGFSLAAAEELRPLGITVSVICPDAVQTPMLDLQVDYPEADITFSGTRPLSVDKVARMIVGNVLRNRPLEATLPLSRGLIARLVGVVPDLGRTLIPFLSQRGHREREARLRARKSDS